jgi:signal transduction histidine kinase
LDRMPWDTLTLIALPVALLAATVSGAIVVSGWKQRRDLQLRVSRVQAPDRLELGRTPLASGPIDVASEAEAVLGLFAGQAAASHVALEFAVQPQLTVRADPRAFREMLFDLVDNAVAHASCGRVLLGAARSGPRVEIAVLDDSANSNQQDRRSELRSA